VPLALVTYPVIDPVLVHLGPLPIRWYALAFIAALVAGWVGTRLLYGRTDLWGARKHPSVLAMDDLVVYMAAGIILGGRIGYVLFYNLSYYLQHPLEMVTVWNGGMSFHGGLLGAIVAMTAFAWRNKVSVLSVTDAVSVTVPIGIVCVRLANFIKPELWGRPTDVAWAMIFPGSDGQPRHPSQLYEGGLEGVVLFCILLAIVARVGLRRDGLVTACFLIGYGVARIICEFFREPDKQLGYLWHGATMGQLLSIPLILAGLALLVRALRRPRAADAVPAGAAEATA
jgi:phosphatidylglycerol---prolipoprotein diacylglyceryl transferase